MSLIPWNKTMCLGVESMDADHHKMADIINTVFDALQAGEDKAEIDKKLDLLAYESIGHFDREEQLMLDAGYPEEEWQAHRESHNDLKQSILDLQEHYIADRDATVTLENFELVRRWMHEHIQGPDKHFADFMHPEAGTPDR